MSETPALFPGTWAERTPDKPAIVIAETGETMTYAELDDAANRCGRASGSAGRRRLPSPP